MKSLLDDLKTQFEAFCAIPPFIVFGNFLFLGIVGLCLRAFIEHLRINSGGYTGQNIGYLLFWCPYILMLIYALYANLLDKVADPLSLAKTTPVRADIKKTSGKR